MLAKKDLYDSAQNDALSHRDLTIRKFSPTFRFLIIPFYY